MLHMTYKKRYTAYHIGDSFRARKVEFRIINGGNYKHIGEEGAGYCLVIPMFGGKLLMKDRTEYASTYSMTQYWNILDRRVLIEKVGCVI